MTGIIKDKNLIREDIIPPLYFRGVAMETVQSKNVIQNIKKSSFIQTVARDFVVNKYIYIMLIPVILYYVVFHYAPMYGAIIAFKNFSPAKGILGSDWVGLTNFIDFFESFYFIRIFKNTLLISFYQLLFGFPAPIIMALLLNEIKNRRFKSLIQTATYLPHFISIVVICGMIIDFTSSRGVITNIAAFFGGESTNLLMKPELFRTIYVSSDIWQSAGWGSIIYLAALSGIDEQMYEAAKIDGANRWRQVISITIPSIMPTIIILLILRMGQIMNLGFEKIILLYNSVTYETSDVISSFVYRKGLLEFNYSYSAAVGLFNSVINFFLLLTANWLSRKVNETSLW